VRFDPKRPPVDHFPQGTGGWFPLVGLPLLRACVGINHRIENLSGINANLKIFHGL